MSVTKRRIFDYSNWLALFWGAVIGYLSLSPLSALPEVAVNDKLEHFAAYGVLALLGTVSRRSKQGTIWVLLVIIAYGGAIEIIQPYVNRYMELGDFIANACGALFGTMLSSILNRVTALMDYR